MQDLNPDIIGTNPTYPKIVDHDWLKPDPTLYDNYPSDNNSVRIVPKLSDLWNHKPSGITLIPNQTVQPLVNPIHNSSGKTASEIKNEVIREAKKAMMIGLTGRDLANHLRSRFIPEEIVIAKDSLTELSQECGLLGNIYIDASAFTSAKEFEQFMAQHRTRLAQDIVINESKITPDAIKILASKFRKNVISSVNYDKDTLEKYRNHLIASGKISNDYVVDSKESLRKAFSEQIVTNIVAEKQEKKVDKKELFEGLQKQQGWNEASEKEASEDLSFRKILPILDFTRSQLVKGKNGSDLKEMLRKKYSSEDICESTKYLNIITAELKGGSFNTEAVDSFIKNGTITDFAGSELKKLAQKYNYVKQEYSLPKVEHQVGIVAQLHALNGNTVIANNNESYIKAATEALKKGYDVEVIKTKLLTKISKEETDVVLLGAINAFNANPSTISNTPKKQAKEIYEDVPKADVLPDPTTIASITNDILSFFDGKTDLTIDIGSNHNQIPIEINGLTEKSGLDAVI